jgi:hypothetical protein
VSRSTGEAITIPGRAMLQASELRGATPSTLDDGSWAHMRPPEPCGEGAYPSAALCRSSRAISAVVGVNGTFNVTVEYVGVYWPNGARRYVRDLQRALVTCRGMDGQGSWKVIDTGLAGRYSLLLRLGQRADHAGRTATWVSFIAIARVGRVLVVVADIGGEAGDGRRELVAELISPALRRTNFLL